MDTKEKITAHSYDNINLRINDLKNNTNTQKVINMSLATKLSPNLLNTILLAKKVY